MEGRPALRGVACCTSKALSRFVASRNFPIRGTWQQSAGAGTLLPILSAIMPVVPRREASPAENCCCGPEFGRIVRAALTEARVSMLTRFLRIRGIAPAAIP